jgi:hypothetical protein
MVARKWRIEEFKDGKWQTVFMGKKDEARSRFQELTPKPGQYAMFNSKGDAVAQLVIIGSFSLEQQITVK